MQPTASVPITVYVVVADGEATGLAQAVHDRPVAGLQEYVEAPVAASVVDPPGQMETLLPALTVGMGLTVTVTLAESRQPAALVPITL